jgi:hypothetical protein
MLPRAQQIHEFQVDDISAVFLGKFQEFLRLHERSSCGFMKNYRLWAGTPDIQALLKAINTPRLKCEGSEWYKRLYSNGIYGYWRIYRQ